MSERWFRITIVLLAIFAHVIAFLQFKFFLYVVAIPTDWNNSFLGLLVLSLLIVPLLLVCRRQRWILTLLSIQAVIALIAGQLLGDYFGVQLTLLVMVIILAFTYTNFKLGLIFGVAAFLLGYFSQFRIVTIFGMVPPTFTFFKQLNYIIFMVLIIAISGILRYQRENQMSATELHHRLQESTLELAQTNMKLQEYAIAAEQEATLKERKRVAREIHDTLAYTLTNLVMMMEAAIDLSPQENSQLIRHLESARDQAKEGLVEVRYALQALRPVHLEGFNGLSAIQTLVQAFEKATQIKVELEFANVPLFLGEETDQTIYRLVQEGMTNALRHGKANHISITFSKDDQKLYVTIKDNGMGSDKIGPKTGFGLIGMQERIEKLGGCLEISSVPGRGFTLSAWFPLRQEC
jgi:signal transduction histidine kinase